MEEAHEQQASAEAPAKEPAKQRSLLQRVGRSAVGWGLVFVLLAGYFVWLASEMGGHALTGIGPLVAVFVAAALGVLLAGAALVLARRDREH